MVWVLISASFSTFTYMSAEMPIPASPLSLHPFVSSAFLVLCAHPMSKKLLYFFFSTNRFLHLLIPFLCPFPLGNCHLHPHSPVVAPSKEQGQCCSGSESSGMGHMKSVRSFLSSSLGSNIHFCHQHNGSNYPRDMRSEICPLFPQVML